MLRESEAERKLERKIMRKKNRRETPTDRERVERERNTVKQWKIKRRTWSRVRYYIENKVFTMKGDSNLITKLPLPFLHLQAISLSQAPSSSLDWEDYIVFSFAFLDNPSEHRDKIKIKNIALNN